jgi:hypothetical protein
MAVPETSREDIAAALAARRELGADYDDALVVSFLDRLERTIDARVQSQASEREHASRELALGSLVLAIPASAIGAAKGLAGVAVVWGGVAAVNLAHVLRDRHRR